MKHLKAKGAHLPSKQLSDVLASFEMESVLCILGKKPKVCEIARFDSLEELTKSVERKEAEETGRGGIDLCA